MWKQLPKPGHASLGASVVSVAECPDNIMSDVELQRRGSTLKLYEAVQFKWETEPFTRYLLGMPTHLPRLCGIHECRWPPGGVGNARVLCTFASKGVDHTMWLASPVVYLQIPYRKKLLLATAHRPG